MRVLVIDCYESTHPDHHVVRAAMDVLQAKGHELEHLRVTGDNFDGYMTSDERLAYESDTPLIAADTKAHAASVQRADALLFCYPTVMFGVPPELKAWLERVMVQGVAFIFDRKNRVRPGLKNIRYLGVVTTTPHSRAKTTTHRDLGHRTIMRTLRLNCNPKCRRTFVRLKAGAATGLNATASRRFATWR